jgi:hypothetical protein
VWLLGRHANNPAAFVKVIDLFLFLKTIKIDENSRKRRASGVALLSTASFSTNSRRPESSQHSPHGHDRPCWYVALPHFFPLRHPLVIRVLLLLLLLFIFTQDPYVKIYLVHNGQRVAKKKTHVKKRTLNPVFNESFVFDLPASATSLDNISLEFLVLDWDRVTKNEVIFDDCLIRVGSE